MAYKARNIIGPHLVDIEMGRSWINGDVITGIWWRYLFVYIYIYTYTLTFILIDVYDEDIDGDIIYNGV